MSDPRKALQNLDKHMVEDILATTDEEIEAECLADGFDPDEVARRWKQWVEDVFARHAWGRKR